MNQIYVIESRAFDGELRYEFSEGQLISVAVPAGLAVEVRKAIFQTAPMNVPELMAMVEKSKSKGTLKAFYKLEKYEFQDFWKLYPKKEKKAETEKSWGKMSEQDKIKAIAYLPIFLRKKEKNKEFLPLPTTYLNQRIYEDLTQ